MRGPAVYLAIAATLAAPGPTNTLFFLSGATAGLRASLRLLLPALLGYGLAIGALLMVAAPLVATEPRLGDALRVAAAVVLAHAAYKLWSKADRHTRPSSGPGTNAVSDWTLFLATLLNPKSLVFAALLMPNGAPALGTSFVSIVAFLSAMIVVSGVGWIAAGAAVSALKTDGAASGLVERGGAVVLLAFAALLTTSVIVR